MTETLHRVIIAGIKPGQDPTQVRAKLCKVFKQDETRVQQLLDAAPVTLTKNASTAKARQMRDLIRAAGAVCRTEPPLPNPPPADAPRVLKRCPKCGYAATKQEDPLFTGFDGQGECPRCGVIPAKFEAASQQQSQQPTPSTPGPSLSMPTLARTRTRGDWRGLRIGLYVALILLLPSFAIWRLWLFMNSDAPELAKAKAQTAEASFQDAVADVERRQAMIEGEPPIAYSLEPGAARVFVLETWLPLMHSSEYLPLRFDTRPDQVVIGVVSTGTEKAAGGQSADAIASRIARADTIAKVAQVEHISTTIAAQSMTLWERLDQSNRRWIPQSLYSRWGVRPFSEQPVPSALLAVDQPAEMIRDAELLQPRNPGQGLDVRQGDYLLYQLSIRFSVKPMVDDPQATAGLVAVGLAPIAFFADGDTRRLLDDRYLTHGQRWSVMQSAGGRWMLNLSRHVLLELSREHPPAPWTLTLGQHLRAHEHWALSPAENRP